ncbi:hypothetical protein TrST_g14178 [Triparma strigata]|uniref:Protein arginine methyltransferase NDUFAF7 n=1 Tax=Triparma strigata TaxID=1606541 RepID=A0A9W7A388_9STRA|nr:hypothetical protein TrST_g14178 [Triparma strigata]
MLQRSVLHCLSVVPPPQTLNAPTPKSFSTPLEAALHKQIQTLGPLPLPTYTSLCMTHPTFGYYTTSNPLASDLNKGDFVTSPGLSQAFGETLAAWACYNLKEFRYVEYGPGDGTLCSDFLRTMSQLNRRPSECYLIDESPILIREQHRTLGVTLDSYIHSKDDIPTQSIVVQTGLAKDGRTRVTWLKDLPPVNVKVPELIVCHEFLDALPAHVFQFKGGRWRERMVDINWEGEEEVKVEVNSQAYTGVKKQDLTEISKSSNLRLVLSQTPTPALKTLLKTDGKGISKLVPGKENEVIEIQPEALSLIQEFSTRISVNRGLALLIDYVGKGDTTRAFSDHEQVEVLERPGECDITVSCDYDQYEKEVEGKGAVCWRRGQGEFLVECGMGNRVQSLIESDDTTVEEANKIYAGFEKIVEDMKTFEVMVIGGESNIQGVKRGTPIGFK